MEEHRTDVIQVPIEREDTASSLVRPDFDLVIVSTGYEERLRLVEINAADRAIVLFEPVDQGAHAVIPQLDRRGVERNENPWSGEPVSFWYLLQVAVEEYRLGWKAMPLARDDLDSN